MNKTKRAKRAKLKAKQLNQVRHMRKIELSKTPRYIKIDIPTKADETDNKSTPEIKQKVVQNPAHLYLKNGFKPYRHLTNKKIFKQLKQESSK